MPSCCWPGTAPGACVAHRLFPPAGGAALAAGRSIPCGALIGPPYGERMRFAPSRSRPRTIGRKKTAFYRAYTTPSTAQPDRELIFATFCPLLTIYNRSHPWRLHPQASSNCQSPGGEARLAPCPMPIQIICSLWNFSISLMRMWRAMP